MIRAAAVGSVSLPDTTTVLFGVVGALVFLLFAVGARLIAQIAVRALRQRHLRPDQVAIGGRVVTFVLIGVGAVVAIGIGIRSENVAIAGIVVATIVASFGVQDLLKDYVSGYYVLLERNIKVGDRISLESGSGTVIEVRLRVSLLRSDSGDLVVVPNSELFNRPVTVHGREAAAPAQVPESEAKPKRRG